MLLLLAGLAGWWGWSSSRRDAGESGAAAAGSMRSAAGARAGRVSAAVDVATVSRGAIEGTVRDPRGAPIAAAQVCGLASSHDLSDDDTRDPRCAATGTDGRYRLTDLLPASYQIDGSAASFRPAAYRDRGQSAVRLAAGETRRGVDLVLQPGGLDVIGAVKDIGGGPIEGAWVRATSRRAGASALTRTAADGSFRLWFVPGDLRLEAQADGYANGERIAAAPGQTIEILLTPESVLAGRVVEAGSGAAVAGARVEVDESSAISDGDGRFRLTRLPPGRYKPYATTPTGVGKARDSVLLGLGQTVEGVVIELHPAVALTGRVVVAGSEAPCPDGSLQLTQPESGRWRDAPVIDGRVAMDGVLAGTYKISVACTGFVTDQPLADLVVAAPLAEQRWTVRPGARIRGTVRAADGAPVAGAHIVATPGEGAMVGGHAPSERDGSFQIDGLPGGTYLVSAMPIDLPSMAVGVPVTVADGGEASAELRLDRGGDLVGEVVDERGVPIAGATVTATAEEGAQEEFDRRTQTLDGGTFTLAGLPAGRHRVMIVPQGTDDWLRPSGRADGEDPAAKVMITAGATARVRLVMESRSGVIRGRVVDGDGAAITDAFVDAVREPGQAGESVREAIRFGQSRTPVLTDTDGRFAVGGLSRGTYTLRAYRRGGGESLAEGVAPGATVTLAIRPTGSIAGTVRLATGAAPERMTVTAHDQESGVRRRESFFRTGGGFAIRDLPAGKFALSVESVEGNASTLVVVAPGQAVTGLAMVLRGRGALVGRLVASDGTPLPGQQVIVRPGPSGGSSPLWAGEGTSTDERGMFRVEGLPAGPVTVASMPAEGPGSSYGSVSQSATVEPGRTTDLGDLHAPRL